GELQGDLAGAASDVDPPPAAWWGGGGRAGGHARQHFTAQRLVGREAIEDVVVDDAVPDRQRALKAPVRASRHGRPKPLHAGDGAHERAARACSTAFRNCSRVNGLRRIGWKPIPLPSSITSAVPS